MELKLDISQSMLSNFESFNRTSMELKQKLNNGGAGSEPTFNRTSMELKLLQDTLKPILYPTF